MKKNLLTLGLLGVSLGAFAQTPCSNAPFQATRTGPWVPVNTTTVQSPPVLAITQFQTISPTFCWALGRDGASTAMSPPSNLLLTSRTVASATTPGGSVSGNEFIFNSVSGSPTYQPANIFAINQTVAFCGQYTGQNGGGGEVIRTTNGGARWRVITTPAQFSLPEGFCNFVYMFDANEGIAVGDPNPLPAGTGSGVHEIQRTTNASAATPTWTRITGIPAPLGRAEYGIVNSYTGLGNTVWFGTNYKDAAGNDGPARVFRSTDRGLTWNVYNTPLVGSLDQLAFKDQNNGIAFKVTATGAELIRTTDGGVTWATQAIPAGRDTLCGRFYRSEIGAIPGKGFISVGNANTATAYYAANTGVSFSADGITWIDVERGLQRGIGSINSQGLIDGPVSIDNPFGLHGYVGGFTNRAGGMNGAGGQGGIFQVRSGLGLATRDAALQRSLTVYPNPSANGQFNISLADGIKAGTQLAVFDIMGRVVTTRTLNATAVNAKSIELDLGGQKTGVYTLRLSTAEGIATEKLVIQ